MLYAIKILISAVLITVISEVSKRYSLMAGILASLPIVSILSFIWLYIDTQNVEKISQLSMSIFWMVLPSLSFFIILTVLLEKGLPFYPSLIFSISCLVILYFLMLFVLNKLGIAV